MSQEVTLNTWPDNQACCGCNNGCLLIPDEGHQCGYICYQKFSPDGKGDHGCSKYEKNRG